MRWLLIQRHHIVIQNLHKRMSKYCKWTWITPEFSVEGSLILTYLISREAWEHILHANFQGTRYGLWSRQQGSSVTRVLPIGSNNSRRPLNFNTVHASHSRLYIYSPTEDLFGSDGLDDSVNHIHDENTERDLTAQSMIFVVKDSPGCVGL